MENYTFIRKKKNHTNRITQYNKTFKLFEKTGQKTLDAQCDLSF